MPTGPKHKKFTRDDGDPESVWAEQCRCMIGEDHFADEDEPAGEGLSESDAEDIWLSSGMDEDYDFR